MRINGSMQCGSYGAQRKIAIGDDSWRNRMALNILLRDVGDFWVRQKLFDSSRFKMKKQQNSTCRAVHECRQISQSVLPGWDRASTVVPADRAFAVVQRASIDPGWNHWWTLLPCSSPAPATGPLSPLVISVTDQVKFNGWHRQTDNTKAVHSFVHFIYRNTQ